MKTAIIFESYHHGNTKKICDAILQKQDIISLMQGQYVEDLENMT